MALSDELVTKISREMVEEEVQKARKQIIPVIKKQLAQYMASKAFLKRLKATVKEEVENEMEDQSMLGYLPSKEVKALYEKAVRKVLGLCK